MSSISSEQVCPPKCPKGFVCKKQKCVLNATKKRFIFVDKLPSPVKIKTPSPLVKTPSPVEPGCPPKCPKGFVCKKQKCVLNVTKKRFIFVDKLPSPEKVKTQKLLLKTPSPVVKTPSPVKVKTPSPLKVKTPSPVVKTPSPVVKTPSPVVKTPSPVVQQTVRLIYKAQPNSGLMKDVSIIKSALTAYKIVEVNMVDRHERTRRQESVYLQIFIEHVQVEDYARQFPAQISYILINHEWVYDWDMAAIRAGLIPLCKTMVAYNIFKSLSGLKVAPLYIGFGNNEHIPPAREKISGLTIHFAGTSPTKGTLHLMKAWDHYIYREGVLIVSCSNDYNQHKELYDFWEALKPHKKVLLPAHILKTSPLLENLLFERIGSLYLYKGSLEHHTKNYLQAVAALNICPSIIEGWGHYIDEARRNSTNVLVLDAPPMNELILPFIKFAGENKSTGQCIPAKPNNVLQHNISKAWTSSLQKDYPVMTYAPASERVMGDYIKRALVTPLSPLTQAAIAANLARSIIEGAQFVERINRLVAAGPAALPIAVPSIAVASAPKLKYCCMNNDECAPIETALKNHTDKYAIITLIFGGDAYLPGVLLLGTSIRKVLPANYTNIELCCMVTPDVSASARALIQKIYDRVIDVEYIKIDPRLIRHNNAIIKEIYAKTFTKLRICEFTQYHKVLLMDADMLVLKPEIFSLFNLKTPASIFMGHLSKDPRDRFFKDFMTTGKLFKQFQQKYCNIGEKPLHGNLIPYSQGRDDEVVSDGMNIETSILLITPSRELVRTRDQFLRSINKPIHGDTEMISRMFKDKIYAIDPRFFGRWANPAEHPELVVLDLYGTNGKPWDVHKLDELAKYAAVGDVTYWWKTYITEYEQTYKSYHSERLDKLYKSILKMKMLTR